MGLDSGVADKITLETGDDDDPVSVQNPLPTDGDSVYEKDIWLDQSTSTNFTGGDVTDLFNNLHTQITNTTSDNPKTIFIHFNRTVVSNAVGLGSAISGDFSNVKIEIVNSGSVFTTVIDESADNTKYTSRTFQLPVTVGFNALRITFHTADTVTLSNAVVLKSRSVVARLQAKKPDNTITDINATTAGNLKVAIEEMEIEAQSPFYLRVAKGEIAGHSIVNKFGQNSDIGTGAYEDILDGGGTYNYPADATASITHIYSTDNGDTQDIEIQGLSSDGTLTVQTITLTGTTVSVLSTALWRVFRMKNVNSTNFTGTIHASDSGKVVSYAQIDDGNNQTLMALYTIPLGKIGYLIQNSVSMAGLVRDYSISVKFWLRPFSKVFQLKATNGLNSSGNSFTSLTNELPSQIPAKTDVRFSAISSTNGGIMNARFSILLIDD